MQTFVLELPCSPENLLIARLTLSGICTRMLMDTADIENAKVALTETCMLSAHRMSCGRLKLTFSSTADVLTVQAECLEKAEYPCDDGFDEEFSSLMLHALADEVTMEEERISFSIIRSI